MKSTKMIINKLDFLDYVCKQVNLDSLSFLKVKNQRQFVHIFQSVKDFRIKKKCSYPIETLLIIIFLAKLFEDGESCTAIARYAHLKKEFLFQLGVIKKDENGNYLIPSHDCFRYFLMNFDSRVIKKIFLRRLKDFLDRIYELNKHAAKYTLLCVDGKELCGTGRSKNSKNPRSNYATLNIYDASSSICFYSESISKKESEIPTAIHLLSYLDLKNKIVTADALHTQVETSEMIIRKNGNYVFRVKDNQKGIREEIVARFTKYPKSIIKVETDDRSFEFLKLSPSYMGVDLVSARTFIKVTSNIKSNNGDILYFVSSLKNPLAIQEAIENRWDIENGLHKSKDFYLNEDYFRVKDKTAAQNFAVINNIIVTLYKYANVIYQDKQLILTQKRFKHEPIECFLLLLSLMSSKELINYLEEHIAQ